MSQGNHQLVLDYLAGTQRRTYRALSRISRDLKNELTEATVREILSQERLSGRITASRHGFRLTESYRDERAQAITAPARTTNVFGPPMSKKNIPSVLGLREGSNDYRTWPTRYV
jgi:hypothetical protein